jgi:hypothetical protein
MPSNALFTGWGQVVRGREQAALEVFGRTVQFWSDQQQAGRIESFEPVLLRPHGGDLAGFILVKGEHPALDEILASEEYTRLTADAGAIVDGLGIVQGFVGEELGTVMGYFGENAQKYTQT